MVAWREEDQTLLWWGNEAKDLAVERYELTLEGNVLPHHERAGFEYAVGRFDNPGEADGYRSLLWAAVHFLPVPVMMVPWDAYLM